MYYDGGKCNFEANQYDFRTYSGSGSCIDGVYNQNSGTPSGHCGLFTWSNTVDVAVGEGNGGDFLFTNADGFKVNVGGTDQTGWCTLSTNEWQYLFNGRDSASNLYKYGVTVCGIANCVVLLPDGWTWDASTVGTGWQTDYPSTSDDKVTWQKMEEAGAVCLPAAGGRDGSLVYDVGGYGDYWSSTAYDEDLAYNVFFYSYGVDPDDNGARNFGCSVRLITESN